MTRRAGFLFGMLLTASVAHAQEITRYTLPAELTYPEGIAVDTAGTTIYTVSAVDGAAARTDVKSGKSEIVVRPGVIVPAGSAFPAALGLKVDRAGRLWIAGGSTGTMSVLDTKTGTVVKTLSTNQKPSFLNDLAITPDAAYFADTLHPVLWRIAVKGDQIGDLEPWIDFAKSPIEFTKGPNLNGIAVTPDGRYLFVVQMNKGLLFRIEIASRAITPVEIGSETVPGGDGLVLDGQTLYVVRQPEGEIVTITLAKDMASGKVVSRFKDPALLWPATAAKVGDTLVVVNTQFNKRTTNDPVTPFHLAIIPLARLKGQ